MDYRELRGAAAAGRGLYYPGLFDWAYTDHSESWNIRSKPVIEQKPLEITTNKPQERKRNPSLIGRMSNGKGNRAALSGWVVAEVRAEVGAEVEVPMQTMAAPGKNIQQSDMKKRDITGRYFYWYCLPYTGPSERPV